MLGRGAVTSTQDPLPRRTRSDHAEEPATSQAPARSQPRMLWSRERPTWGSGVTPATGQPGPGQPLLHDNWSLNTSQWPDPVRPSVRPSRAGSQGGRAPGSPGRRCSAAGGSGGPPSPGRPGEVRQARARPPDSTARKEGWPVGRLAGWGRGGSDRYGNGGEGRGGSGPGTGGGPARGRGGPGGSEEPRARAEGS